MSINPFSPSPTDPQSEFVRDDIPAETDDLVLGDETKRHPDIENAGSDPDSDPRRTGGSANDPHGGRQ
ncbi:MAG: hypothetical protein KL863_25420 [Rhizobium sp.]|nr:hypothetical protein [Rhizobium sp.]